MHKVRGRHAARVPPSYRRIWRKYILFLGCPNFWLALCGQKERERLPQNVFKISLSNVQCGLLRKFRFVLSNNREDWDLTTLVPPIPPPDIDVSAAPAYCPVICPSSIVLRWASQHNTKQHNMTQWLEAEEPRLGSGSRDMVTPGTLRSSMQMNAAATVYCVKRKKKHLSLYRNAQDCACTCTVFHRLKGKKLARREKPDLYTGSPRGSHALAWWMYT